MSRLIDADKATKLLHTVLDPIANKKLILLAWDMVLKNCETIDAEPVRHGKWILTNKPNIYGGTTIKCSVCGYEGVIAHIEDHHYCWVCGAKMDEDEISNIAKESADKISKALYKVRAKGMQKQNIKEDDKP